MLIRLLAGRVSSPGCHLVPLEMPSQHQDAVGNGKKRRLMDVSDGSRLNRGYDEIGL